MTRRLTVAEEDVLLAAVQDETVVASFWARVSKSETCWLWTGAKAGNYGQLQYRRARLLAHRYSWCLTRQQSCPTGLVIRHRCDTPACVRPDHLVVGTTAQNVRDSYERNRRPPATWPVGNERPNSILTDQAVVNLRRAARAGVSVRSLAKSNDISYSTAYRAIRGLGWTHISEAPVPARRTGRPHPANFVRNNPEIAEQARTLRDSGLNLQEVASRLGISKTAAFHCCRIEQKDTP
jgi:hypothetical protein